MSDDLTSPKYSASTFDMCPTPQAGSKQDRDFSWPGLATTCSIRARVAQGGVGKSSRLSLGSILVAITALEVFCTSPCPEMLLTVGLYIGSTAVRSVILLVCTSIAA